MKANDMTPEQEKELLIDVSLIKQKTEHLEDTFKVGLSAFSQHQNETNSQLTEILLQMKELVQESKTSNGRIDNLDSEFNQFKTRVENEFRSQGQKIRELQDFKIVLEQRYESQKNTRKWWSSNWFKIVTLVFISIPVAATIYNLLDK